MPPEREPFVHRFMAAPAAAGVEDDVAHRYWRDHHGELAAKLPHLDGYVQNRALPHWWSRMPFLVCADVWHASAADEVAAYETDYYKKTIEPDEERFINRDGVFYSSVVSSHVIQPGPGARLRVLALGASPDAVKGGEGWSRIEIMNLARAAEPDITLLSAWTDDLELAEGLANSLPAQAFVAAPAVVIAPPEPGWRLSGEPWHWS